MTHPAKLSFNPPSAALRAAIAMPSLPAELRIEVLQYLPGSPLGERTLDALSQTSRATRELVDEACARRTARRLVRGALLEGALREGTAGAQLRRERLVQATQRTKMIELEVPCLERVHKHQRWLQAKQLDATPAAAPAPFEPGRELLDLVELLAPTIAEASHVALRYERPHLAPDKLSLSYRKVNTCAAAERLVELLLSAPRPFLQSLTLYNNKVMEGSWLNRLAANTPHLIHLELCAQLMFIEADTPLPTSLRTLELQNCSLDDRALAHLVALMPQQLQSLDLGYNDLLLPPPLQTLSQLQALTLPTTDYNHLTESRQKLTLLPTQLKALRFSNTPELLGLRTALRNSPCKDAIEELSFVTPPTAPTYGPSLNLTRKLGPEGGSLYTQLCVDELPRLIRVIVPTEEPSTQSRNACVSPNASAMLSRRNYLRLRANKSFEISAEPTFIFVDRQSGQRDVWPPMRQPTPDELKIRPYRPNVQRRPNTLVHNLVRPPFVGPYLDQ